MRVLLVAAWILMAGLRPVWSAAGLEPMALVLEVGQTQVMQHRAVARVAVGNGQVVSAVSVEGADVVLFARQEGTSSVHVWTPDGLGAAYEIQVRPAGWARMQHEVRALLEHIPSVRSSWVGDNIVIEGEDLTDDDRERVSALVQRYPRILDFTGQMGWDRMVLLDVQVVELPSAHLRELGVQWDASPAGGLHAGLAWQPGSSAALSEHQQTPPLSLAGRGAGGYFGLNALLSARIAALAQRGEAVMLAQPQLLARSGATASFLAGGEVPYTTVDARGNSNTAFKPYGVSLSITPRIDRTGAIRSRIEVEASSVDTSISVAGGPALRTRRAATEFNVRSGQTLVLGGFLSRERTNERSGIPVLQDIPVLGALFASNRQQHKQTELAIFVTPSIVSQDHPALTHRVQRARQVLDEAFPDAPPLGTATPASGTVDWRDYRGPGSQRQDAPAQNFSTRTQSGAVSGEGDLKLSPSSHRSIPMGVARNGLSTWQ